MNWVDVIEILKIAGLGYVLIDSICLIYVWCWKEAHFHYNLLWLPIPLTGIMWITSDFKNTFRGMINAED